MTKFKVGMADTTDYTVVAKLPEQLKRYVTIEIAIWKFIRFNIAVQVKA